MILGFQEVEASQVNAWLGGMPSDASRLSALRAISSGIDFETGGLVSAWLREGVERSDPVMESPDGPERWCFFGGSWHRVEEGVHVSGDECRPA